MNHKKIGTNDSAVSPVMGTLLMVAITIILAAVVAAFVMGMVPNMTKTNKIVGISIQQPESGKITVTYIGGQDSGAFAYGNVTVTPGTGSTTGTITYENGTTVGTAGQRSGLSNIVGNSVTITTTGNFAGKDRAIITGTFSDGSVQVLIDTYV